MNWQWLRNAVVSSIISCFEQLLSSFCQLRRNFEDGRPSAKEHPRWQVNRVQIRAIRWTKRLAQWTEGSQAASFCVSGGCGVSWRRPAALIICNGHISPWCRVASLCQAPRYMVSTVNFLPVWMKTISAFCVEHTQHSDGHRSTAAGIFALALSDLWRWCFSWEQLMSKCDHSYVIN